MATGTFVEAEWVFPKGRRAVGEREKECASREFKEETGIQYRLFHILDEPPLIEEYTGTNGIPYKQTYFVACCKSNVVASIQPNNHIMKREIGDISWFTFDAAMAHIRESNVQKRAVMTELHRRVCEGDLRDKITTALEWEIK